MMVSAMESECNLARISLAFAIIRILFLYEIENIGNRPLESNAIIFQGMFCVCFSFFAVGHHLQCI